MWLWQSRGWFLRGFLSVFHHARARNSVKWIICRHISEIPLSTTLNPNQTNKMWPRQSRGWFLQGFLSVFHHARARNSVKWIIRRHISEIPLSTTLNPNQTNKMWSRQSRGWFLRGFLPVFHHTRSRNSVKWTIRHHISEIPLSTTLNPNQTNKQTSQFSTIIGQGTV